MNIENFTTAQAVKYLDDCVRECIVSESAFLRYAKIGRATISRWRRGLVRPDYDTLLKIKDAARRLKERARKRKLRSAGG